MLHILVIADIHGRMDRVQGLINYTESHPKIKFDWVCVLGDICNWNFTPNTIQASENVFGEVMKKLESLGKPIFLLPGNHDVPSKFEPSVNEDIAPAVVNLHKSVFRIKEDLLIAGFGGSVPAYRDGKVIWDGYPFEEDELGAAVDTIISDQSDDSIILLTHNGPAESHTAVNLANPESPILAGSNSLRKTLMKHHERLPLCMHGHTHYAFGLGHLGATRLMNPGALKNGRFGVVSLDRGDDGWEIADCSFVKLL